VSQIADSTAAGVYGNTTDLSTSAFVSAGQTITVTGKWFTPGTATLVWDNTTTLDSAEADAAGTFSASVQVPSDAAAGKHTLTVIDEAAVNFTLTLTRLPTVADNYAVGWHISDFTITLTPDYTVTDTYYKINDGVTQSVSGDGHPQISSEGASITLEYWSVWDVYGTGSMDLPNPHVTLTGIQLDKTEPAGTLQINGGASTTTSTVVTLAISGSDSTSDVSQMRFSNDQTLLDSAAWQAYAGSADWELTGGDGAKTVYCQLQDGAGLTSPTFSAQITLDTSTPTPTPTPPTPTPTPPTPTPTDAPSSTDTPTPTPTVAGSEPTVTPEAPEACSLIIMVLLGMATFFLIVKRRENKQAY
jgi:hypothetical protein